MRIAYTWGTQSWEYMELTEPLTMDSKEKETSSNWSASIQTDK